MQEYVPTAGIPTYTYEYIYIPVYRYMQESTNCSTNQLTTIPGCPLDCKTVSMKAWRDHDSNDLRVHHAKPVTFLQKRTTTSRIGTFPESGMPKKTKMFPRLKGHRLIKNPFKKRARRIKAFFKRKCEKEISFYHFHGKWAIPGLSSLFSSF